jgi:hypothetical protein
MAIDLSNWKLQLPVDRKGTFGGKAAEVPDPRNYSHPDFFHHGSNGALVLAAPVNGATTGGSVYARSELREMNGSAKAGWSLEQGGRLSATVRVDVAPNESDGTFGKVVVGQIHGGNGQLVRLAWEDGTLFFANDITTNGSKDIHIELLSAAGAQPAVSLKEKFSYRLEVSQNQLTVSVQADGQTYSNSSAVNRAWADNDFYFKAGAYLGVNERGGNGIGQVSIFRLDIDHDRSSGLRPTTSISTMSHSANSALSHAATPGDMAPLPKLSASFCDALGHAYLATYSQETGELSYSATGTASASQLTATMGYSPAQLGHGFDIA